MQQSRRQFMTSLAYGPVFISLLQACSKGKGKQFSLSNIHPRPGQKHQRVIVIGAGIAGLSSAYCLHKAGFDVQVLEANERSGGRFLSERFEGVMCNGGSQILSDQFHWLLQFVDEFKLRSDLVPLSTIGTMIRKQKPYLLNRSNPLAFWTSDYLSASEYLHFFKSIVQTRYQTRDIEAFDYEAWLKFDQQSTQTWGQELLGPELVDYLIDPPVNGLFFQVPDQLSQAFTMWLITMFMQQKQLLNLRGGVQRLTDAIAQQLKVRMNQAVQRIEQKDEHFLVHTKQGLFEADKIVFALPAPRVRAIELIGCSFNSVEKRLLETNYNPAMKFVALASKDWCDTNRWREHPLQQSSGIFISHREQNFLGSTSHEYVTDSSFPGQVFHLMPSAQNCQSLWAEDNQTLWDKGVKNFELYYPKLDPGTPHKLFRWQEGLPSFQVGQLGLISAYRKQLTPRSKFYLCGDYTAFPCSEGACESGIFVARHLIDSLDSFS